jgi:hypothetical protein
MKLGRIIDTNNSAYIVKGKDCYAVHYPWEHGTAILSTFDTLHAARSCIGKTTDRGGKLIVGEGITKRFVCKWLCLNCITGWDDAMWTTDDGYEADANGLIRSFGKFEREMYYMPYFYEHADDGEVLDTMQEGSGAYVSLIEISVDDRAKFPELNTALYILIEENDAGFVSGRLVHTEDEAAAIREAYEDKAAIEDAFIERNVKAYAERIG